MGSQLVPDETLDKAIVSIIAMLCMTVSSESAYLTSMQEIQGTMFGHTVCPLKKVSLRIEYVYHISCISSNLIQMHTIIL